MASLNDTLLKLQELDAEQDILQAKWYIIAVRIRHPRPMYPLPGLSTARSPRGNQLTASAQAAALASAGGGADLVDLYKLATHDLALRTELLVQRRIKEAVLKTSCLYGVPKSLQALLPLFASLPDNHIDHAGPRYAWTSCQFVQGLFVC